MKEKKIVIIGGGTAGLSVAHGLARRLSPEQITIVEPNKDHLYQPWWTLVGGGIVEKEDSRRPMTELLKKGIHWVQDFADSFDPQNNKVITKDGTVLDYDYLVVAPGIQSNWHLIDGLTETLGKNGVCSNYSYDSVDSTWENIKNFEGGTAIFTQPNTPIKCAGAPQKIMWLAEEHFRDRGLRDKCQVKFVSGGAAIFGVQKYREALEPLVRDRNIDAHYKHNLVAIRGNDKIAIFENLDTKERVEMKYDMIHVTPPMGPMDFIKKSPLADEAGWVDVDKYTLQHKKFENIFSIGDGSSLPTSRTGAAVREQGPVLINNLMSHMYNQPLVKKYSGYASCPLITGRGKCILAEFDYDGKPMESFPFDQGKERWSMYMLKRHMIPFLYWNAMMKGYF